MQRGAVHPGERVCCQDEADLEPPMGLPTSKEIAGSRDLRSLPACKIGESAHRTVHPVNEVHRRSISSMAPPYLRAGEFQGSSAVAFPRTWVPSGSASEAACRHRRRGRTEEEQVASRPPWPDRVRLPGRAGGQRPVATGCTTINKPAARGRRAVMLAHDSALPVPTRWMVAGSMESYHASLCP